MTWKPNEEEKKYLELVMSMSTDSLMGKGVATRKAYTLNLKAIADRIDGLDGEESK
jgi:hypothetical protein